MCTLFSGKWHLSTISLYDKNVSFYWFYYVKTNKKEKDNLAIDFTKKSEE